MRAAERPRISRVVALAAITAAAVVGAASAAAAGSRATRWVASSPVPANADHSNAALDAVACPPTGSCVAVGTYHDTSGAGHALVVTGSAAKWTPRAVAVPAESTPNGNGLEAVACPQVGDCAAVGEYEDGSGVQRGLLENEKSGRWSPLEAALPANAGSAPTPRLVSVSCSSSRACVAVGEYQDNNGVFHALLLRKARGLWRDVKVPLPADAQPNGTAELGSVSCPPSGGCVAVGMFTPKRDGRNGLVLRDSRGIWHASTAPLPAGARVVGGAMRSVSCPDAGRCTAVGSYSSGASELGLLLDERGAKWRPSRVAAPKGRGVSPSSVACTSPGSCVTVGTRYTPKGAIVPLVVSEAAGHWGSAINVPLPRDWTNGSLVNTVACRSNGACVAGGEYTAQSPTESARWRGLLISDVGSRWRAVAAPLPTVDDVFGAPLASAACSRRGGCVEVGTYQTGKGLSALLERTLPW